MKTVRMLRDFDYRPKRGVIMAYSGGRVYERVPEAAARAIVGNGAGEIVDGDKGRAPRAAPRKDEGAAG